MQMKPMKNISQVGHGDNIQTQDVLKMNQECSTLDSDFRFPTQSVSKATGYELGGRG
jgi:hypothetical protein